MRNLSTSTLFALGLTCGSAAAQTTYPAGKIDRALQQSATNGGTLSVIITVQSGGAGRSEFGRALKSHGDHIDNEHGRISVLSGVIQSEDLALLAADPRVRTISADATVTADADVYASNGATPMVQGRLRQILGFPPSMSLNDYRLKPIDSDSD